MIKIDQLYGQPGIYSFSEKGGGLCGLIAIALINWFVQDILLLCNEIGKILVNYLLVHLIFNHSYREYYFLWLFFIGYIIFKTLIFKALFMEWLNKNVELLRVITIDHLLFTKQINLYKMQNTIFIKTFF